MNTKTSAPAQQIKPSFYPTHYTIRKLLEAGVHLGHVKQKWNPKMAPYIYGVRNGVHVIDLEKTTEMLEKALQFIAQLAAQNGKLLFVSTRANVAGIVEEGAKKCGQYYINKRWPGGLMTNWSTVSKSIRTLKGYETTLADPESTLTKKAKGKLQREFDKLNSLLGGIRTMGGQPDAIFVMGKENKNAIKEANRLKIPVIAIADTNFDPEGVTYLIPGNDDSTKSIELYCNLVSQAVLLGIQESLRNDGIDVGSAV